MIYLNDDMPHFDVETALPLLSEQRREQAMRFKHEQGRRNCIAVYVLLRQALRQEYGITEPPTFEYGPHGKPVIAGHPHIHFNFSHCREAVMCAVSNHPVGVDIESIRPYRESLARYTMSDHELETITHSPSPATAFTRLWTMKEAVLKQRGTGIAGSSMKAVLTGQESIETVVNEEKGYIYSVVY